MKTIVMIIAIIVVCYSSSGKIIDDDAKSRYRTEARVASFLNDTNKIKVRVTGILETLEVADRNCVYWVESGINHITMLTDATVAIMITDGLKSKDINKDSVLFIYSSLCAGLVDFYDYVPSDTWDEIEAVEPILYSIVYYGMNERGMDIDEAVEYFWVCLDTMFLFLEEDEYGNPRNKRHK
jgi:hypothetical protein